jgi:VIT1/CCC1 family predicted Fe2+/Mn2+ transporter
MISVISALISAFIVGFFVGRHSMKKFVKKELNELLLLIEAKAKNII